MTQQFRPKEKTVTGGGATTSTKTPSTSSTGPQMSDNKKKQDTTATIADEKVEVDEPETADQHKERGNSAVRAEKYTEAILHYSFAIKLNPIDPILYSNRSFVFYKLKQLYYANEDAEKAIQYAPDWAKGYFRRAEVQAAAGQYDTALLSYGRALQLQPNDISILNAAKKVAAESNQEVLYQRRLPWLGAAIGIVLGVLIVLADQILTKKPSVSHPILMLLIVITLSGIGYGITKIYEYFRNQQKRGLLEPPLDILDAFKKENKSGDGGDDDDKEELITNRNRYSKAQARQRFKKGKS